MRILSPRLRQRPASIGIRRLPPALPVGLLAVAVYLRALANGFALDDRVDLLQNRFVTGPLDLAGIVTSDFYGSGSIRSGSYRPLVTLTNAIVASVCGLHPLPFHLVNLIVFSAVVVLTVVLVTRLSGDALVGG